MMDFKYGWKQPKIKKSFKSQIDELKKLVQKKPILPFLFCDPRRFDDSHSDENLYKLFNYAFTGDTPFFGVKLYPALGYRPSDYRLDPIFNICNDLRIPVLTHCGGESISTDGKEIIVYEGEKEIILPERKREDMAYELNNPNHWIPVLEKYPNLVLNLAHFGSDDTWSAVGRVSTKIDPQQRKEAIFDLINNYENVYADFSYTIANESATDNFITVITNNARIRKRSLFGSDFWVVNGAGNLDDNQATFLDAVKKADPALVDVLCKENPRRYLFGELDFLK